MVTSLTSYLESLATAGNRFMLRARVMEGCAIPPRDAEESELYDACTRISYAIDWLYLMDDGILEDVLRQAQQALQRIRDPFRHALAQMHIAVAAHRLARNRWQRVSTLAATLTIERRLIELHEMTKAVAQDDLRRHEVVRAQSGWTMELAHVARYIGDAKKAKRLYERAAKMAWDAGDELHEAVASHYLASLFCDVLLMYVPVIHTLPQEAHDQVCACAKRGLSFVEKTRAACESYGYLTLAAHQGKHASICHALLAGDQRLAAPDREHHDAEAREKMDATVRFFRDMGLVIPQINCICATILVNGRKREVAQLAREFLDQALGPGAVVPREKMEALVLARLMASIEELPGAHVGPHAERAMWESGLLLHPLRDRMWEQLWRSVCTDN